MRNMARLSFFIFLLVAVAHGYADVLKSKWVSLDADSKNRLMRIVQSEVESREGFSTQEEDKTNTRLVEEERQKEMSIYKAGINSANSEFVRTKKRRDDLTAQFQTASYDFEEYKKSYNTIRTSIENIDNQIARYQHDIKAQRESLTTWLKTEKQGEAIVAVIYTRGFKDTAHELESLADQASAPLMAQHMGTYIQSFTKVIDNVLTSDFIRAIEEGTAEWNREEPLRIVLKKSIRGTTYLRVKRYELYPFQAPKAGHAKPGAASSDMQVVVLSSQADLETFLKRNGFEVEKLDLGRAEAMLRETALANRQAEEGLREQLISFRERINYLEKKIATVKQDKDFQVPRLNEKKVQLDKMQTELEVLRLKKDSAVMAFQDAQSALHEKKRVHESIVVKTSLVTAKRSQTPAEASAEAVIEELSEVLNDAKLQHSTSTTDVADFQVVGETSAQAVTEAKIIAVRLLSFINEGDSVRVKMAFRVRTVLDEKKEDPVAAGTYRTLAPAAPAPQSTATPPAATPSVQTEAPPMVTAKATPPPRISATGLATAEMEEFLFELNKVSKAGNEVTFLVGATNNSKSTKYLAFYDETTGYTRSSIASQAGELQGVNLVYLWQGDVKTPASDARRGVAVEPGKSVVVELIFKEMAPDTTVVSQFNLHPYVGTRSFIMTYSWTSRDLSFENVRVR